MSTTDRSRKPNTTELKTTNEQTRTNRSAQRLYRNCYWEHFGNTVFYELRQQRRSLFEAKAEAEAAVSQKKRQALK